MYVQDVLFKKIIHSKFPTYLISQNNDRDTQEGKLYQSTL